MHATDFQRFSQLTWFSLGTKTHECMKNLYFEHVEKQNITNKTTKTNKSKQEYLIKYKDR